MILRKIFEEKFKKLGSLSYNVLICMTLIAEYVMSFNIWFEKWFLHIKYFNTNLCKI